MVEGVNLAVLDVRSPSVDADGGAVHDQPLHTAALDRSAGSIGLDDPRFAHRGLGEANQAPWDFDNFGSAVTSCHFDFLVQRNGDLIGLQRGRSIPRRQHADHLGVGFYLSRHDRFNHLGQPRADFSRLKLQRPRQANQGVKV
ncbi:hypothetical protein D9M70_516190 [compost metagenome]